MTDSIEYIPQLQLLWVGAMNVIVIVVVVSVVALVVVVPWLKRVDPDEYERTTFPPVVGWGQGEGIYGFLVPIFLAPIVGVVTGVIAWNLWLVPVVTVAGAVLGIVVGLGGWMLIVTIDKYWLQLGVAVMYIAEPVVLVGGPATTILVGVLALVYVPDLSLPLWLGVLGGLVFVLLGWRQRAGESMDDAPVSVPDVRGLTLSEARRLADSSSLAIACGPITPRRLGHVVVTQEPARGEMVKVFSVLRVTAVAPSAASDASL